jgi:beta-lactamase regulating signal transducer with metallopeptidase domain
VISIPALVVALLVKPGLVLGGAAAIAACLRRRPAAARHLVWAGALLAILALPLLNRALPPLRLPAALGVVEWRPSSLSPVESPVSSGGSGAGSAEATAFPALQSPERSDGDATEVIGSVLFALWLLGAAVLGARRILAEIRVRRILRAGRPITGPELEGWVGPIAGLNTIRRPVRFRLCDAITSPGVAGVLRPVVLLPAAVADWPRDRLAQGLTHEFAHITRYDCLLNLAADLAGIIYWCNPLVRAGLRRMRTESEHACDDRVLTSGAEPGAYAGLLLSLAHASRMEDGMPGAVTAMARPRELEARLLAVLDTRIARDPLPRWMAPALAGLGLLLSLPAAALAVDRTPQTGTDLVAGEPDRRRDSLADPASERLPQAIDSAGAVRVAGHALTGPDSALALHLLAALGRQPHGEEDLVHERAAWALSRARGDRLVEPLLDALDEPDWRVRSYAAWALAPAREPRAASRLVPLLAHPVWRLRAIAAHALGELADPGTTDAMHAALTDPAWQVRVEAVEYFARLRGSDLAERLRPRLTDRHVAVRHAAEQALTSR